MKPIDKAVSSWKSQLQLPEEDHLSMRAHAEKYGVAQSTLSRRLSGLQVPHLQAHTHRQALSPDQEKALVDFICQLDSVGDPPSPQTVTQAAIHLRNCVFLDPSANPPVTFKLSHNWVSCFRKRHPIVNSSFSRDIDSQRVEAKDPSKLVPWFTKVKALMGQHRYPPSMIFNMDETGFAIGANSQSTHVLTVTDGPRRQKPTQASTA